MFIRAIRNIVTSCVLLGSIARVHAAQETQVKKVPLTSPSPQSGAELFKQHCAVCHGNDLKGSGSFLAPYRRPPDLTTLARRHGGQFPDAYVSSVLRDGVIMPAHGPAEMPVWGEEFRVKDRLDETQVKLRITNLIKYIKSFQEK